MTEVIRGPAQIINTVAELRQRADDVRHNGGTVGLFGTSGNCTRDT